MLKFPSAQDGSHLENRHPLRKPPDYYSARKLPPLPPDNTPDLRQTTEHAKETKGFIRNHVIHDRNKPTPHSTVVLPIENCKEISHKKEDKLSKHLLATSTLSKITLDSCTENSIRIKESDSCNKITDQLVLDCSKLLELKPELQQIIVSTNNSNRDCDLIRTEFHKFMSALNPISFSESMKSCEKGPVKLEEVRNNSLEHKVTVKKVSSEGESSDDDRRRLEEAGPSTSRKSRSVRFQGPSPPPSKQKSHSERRRRRRRSSWKYKDQFNIRCDQDDASSTCSTCSSSSSSDDPSVYELPPRRAYGGVRISYVPNDALAAVKQRQLAAEHKSPTAKKQQAEKTCTIS